MTSRPLLSVCIPTYNRAGFLRECLASLCKDGVEDLVEVVVSDNASSDDTIAVLEEFSLTLPMRHVVQAENIGADRNFDAVIAFAQGEYCWLLGSDDVVESNTLRKMIALLQTQQTDILHFGYVQTDLTLNRLFNASPLAGRVANTPGELAAYLGGQHNLSLLFAFISSFAFRRSLWMDRHAQVQRWIGTHYIHMFTMHAALTAGATLAATSDCLVLARGGNPNDFNTVPGRFIALDARTMSRLVQEIHGDDPRFWQAIGRTFRRSYPPKALIHVAANGGLQYLADSRAALIRLGYPRGLLNALTLLGRLNLLKVVKRALDIRRNAVQRFRPQRSIT